MSADSKARLGEKPSGLVESTEGRFDTNATRILVLAPSSNDGPLTVQFLRQGGLEATLCTDMEDVCAKIEIGCAAALIAEESLSNAATELLASSLVRQPSWSDLSILIITGNGDPAIRRSYLAALKPVGSVSIIERPVRPATLVSAFEVALRSRRRQYEIDRLIKERERMTADLQRDDRRKDEFLAMLAHELRNPLASIASAAALLEDSQDIDCYQWAGKIIHRQSRHLARLIDDLLDVSRITTDKIRLRKEMLDVATCLNRACESVRPLVKARGHEVVCAYEQGKLWLEADATRVEQVFINLLANAAKYSPNGGVIHISAFAEAREVVVRIRDNGVGIEPGRLSEMFQLFVQGERSLARSEGGLGIGLTIVQRLVEMHGGHVEAQSDGLNLGSTFTVRLPAAPLHSVPKLVPVPPAEATSAVSLRILIVDDNSDTAQALARLLQNAGHDTAVAEDGAKALEKARAHRPHAILLDIGLPDMDGYEVLRHLRATPASRDAVIIAATGYGQEEDRQRALTAGFDHHLVKPVRFKELKNLLSHSLGTKSERSPA